MHRALRALLCHLAACRAVCSTSVCTGSFCIFAKQHPSTSEMPSKSTLQGKLHRRERAKAESSRKKEKGRAKQSDRRHRSSDKQSRGTPSKKTAQRQKKARSLPSCATAWTADPQPGRLRGAANPQRPLIGTGIEPSHGHQTQVPGFSAAVHSGHA